MATERLPMRHVREIFRQKLVMKRSNRDVARSLGISAGTVSGAMSRGKALGLDWEAMALLSDDALEARLYGPRCTTRGGRPFPDPVRIPLDSAAHSATTRPPVPEHPAAIGAQRRVPLRDRSAGTLG